MPEHEVAIVGAGPVGMVLAAELALAGVDVVAIERRPDHELVGSRAGGLQSRAIELLDQRGVADRFLAEGKAVQAATFGSLTIDIGDFPTRHPYALGLWQNHVERILGGWIGELEVKVMRGREAKRLGQDAEAVEVELDDGASVRSRYLVGADGGRSLVRRLAGIDFPGSEATVSNLIAEVEVTEDTPTGARYDATGVHGLHVMEDGHTVRIVTTEHELRTAPEPTLDDLKRALVAVYGTHFGVHNPTWLSRFTNATRQAATYRERRVLLAGDSAHVHSPAGGGGLTLGFQDAFNLGWKLAQVVRGTAPGSLLDTYHDERHPAAYRSLRYTMAQTAMMRPDNHAEALRESVAEICRLDEPRRLLGGLISGLDTLYDLGAGHPQLGRRVPDLDLEVAGRPARLFSHLHGARPLLVNLGQPRAMTAGAWSDRVDLLEARFDGSWELPVLGAVPAPAAVLVRPDGHVAWVGEGSSDGLEAALEKWFGPP